MEYLRHTKIIVLPYNSSKNRDEIDKFDMTISEELKKKFMVENIKLLKKDELLTPSNKIMGDRRLYISQNSLSDTLKNFKDGRVCILFIPGKYNINNENIIIENIKFFVLNDKNDEDYSTINIMGNVIIHCQYFSAIGVKFMINNDKDKYFSQQHLTYSGLIFTEKLKTLSFSNCAFENDKNNKDSKDVNIFYIKDGTEQITIEKCIFNNSNFEIQNANTSIISNNRFMSTDINIRYSNCMFYKNQFEGYFRLNLFNSYLVQINSNNFIDIDAYSYCINADHNTKLYLTNNKITTNNEKFSIVKVFRNNNCYMDNNNIELKDNQILSTVEFMGELYVLDNTFNKNDIEVAYYDAKLYTDKNNKLINNLNDEIKFVVTERDIIKPTSKGITLC